MLPTISIILRRTVIELRKAGIKSHELDARVLFEAAVNKNTAQIFAHPEAPMCNAEYSKFRRYIRRRKKGEPVAYILGRKEFYGLDFLVNKNVLIPRPETELLVEEALQDLNNQLSSKQNPCPEVRFSNIDFRQKDANRPKNLKSKIYILDIGTGSGCIVISLIKSISAKYLIPNTRFYATDISKKALVVAKKNAQQHNVSSSIRFYHSDLFSNQRLPQKFDLVVANLPYVPRATNRQTIDAIKFEPKDAIFADQKGTAIIKRFIDEVKDRVTENGLILIELDPRNAKTLHDYALKKFPKAKIELKKDLAQKNRYLKISTNPD